MRRPSRLLLALPLVFAPVLVAAPLEQSADPKRVLVDGFQALVRLKSYRIRSIVSAKTTSTTTFEFVAPNRFHVLSDKSETIVTPGETYIRYKGGNWGVAKVNVAELIARFREPKDAEEAEKAHDFKLVGTEDIDNGPAFVYSYVTATGENVKVWLAVADGLPRKKESETQYGSEKVRSVQMYEYDLNISISAPIG